jgi:hypothetical protein
MTSEEIKVETAEELRKARAEEFSKAPPSRVVEMALEDIEAVEAHPDIYRVNMDIWHRPRLLEGEDGRLKKKCVVCLAGSVIANSLGADPDVNYSPADYGAATYARLSALNVFRQGAEEIGLQTMGYHNIAEKLGPRKERYAPYAGNKTQFKAYMRDLVQRLRDAGL